MSKNLDLAMSAAREYKALRDRDPGQKVKLAQLKEDINHFVGRWDDDRRFVLPDAVLRAMGEGPSSAEMIAASLRNILGGTHSQRAELAAFIADKTGSLSLRIYEPNVRSRLERDYDASAWDDAMEILRTDEAAPNG